jgi:tetratricopeptide (TPR) repeat protein
MAKKYVSILFLLFPILLYAQEHDGMLADVFLSETMLKEVSIKTKLINSIDYTNDGFLLVSSSNQFYVLGIGFIEQLFNPTKKNIDAFTITPEGKLHIVSGKELCKIDTLGNFRKIYSLPNTKMGIASDEDKIYVFDQLIQKGLKEYSLFSLDRKLFWKKSISMKTPITSVFEYKSSLFFSSENKLYCSNEQTKSFIEIISLPQKTNTIISIVGDSIHNALYFSSKDTIYRIKGNKLEYVSTEFGGILRYDGEGLLIFNPEKSVVIRLRNSMLYPPSEEYKLEQEDIVAINESVNKNTTQQNLDEARKMVSNSQILKAIYTYSQMLKNDRNNQVILEEYAYALALGGFFEGALLQLDKCWKTMPTTYSYFYASQVFALMKLEEIAKKITNDSIPAWIADKYSDFEKKYKQNPNFYGQDTVSFTEANSLSEKGLYFKAIVCFDKLTKEYPQVYIIHAGYSIPLEKLGINTFAIEELDKSIALMPDDPKFDEIKQNFKQHIAWLSKKENMPNLSQPQKSNLLTKIKNYHPKMMLYAGGIFTLNYISFNSRFGVYVSNKVSASVNLGIAGNIKDKENPVSFNLGLSGYYHLYRIFFVGLGISEQFVGKDNNTFSINPSAGVSLVSNSRKSSWDIYFDLYCPVKKGSTPVLGITIGKSFYLESVYNI